MKLITFLFINFIVAMISDITLNHIANNKVPTFIKSEILFPK